MPGVDGPATLSLIACQPMAARTCSLSKRSASTCPALEVNSWIRVLRCLRFLAASRPIVASVRRSSRPRMRGSGAVMSKIGSTAWAASWRSSSKTGRARASAGEKCLVASTFSAMSSPSR